MTIYEIRAAQRNDNRDLQSAKFDDDLNDNVLRLAEQISFRHPEYTWRQCKEAARRELGQAIN